MQPAYFEQFDYRPHYPLGSRIFIQRREWVLPFCRGSIHTHTHRHTVEYRVGHWHTELTVASIRNTSGTRFAYWMITEVDLL